MENNKKYTVIEVVADYIFFVITGSQNQLNKFSRDLNSPHRKFISVRIDVPLAFICEDLEKNYNGKIIIESGTESAQSFTLARHSFIHNKTNKNEDDFNDKTHMLVVLEEDYDNDCYKLKFPKLELQDEDDPEEIVLKWVKVNGGKISKNMKRTIKPITLVGFNEDILVYTAKL